MRTQLFVSALALAVTAPLLGCRIVGPNYTRPAIDTPAAWAGRAPLAVDPGRALAAVRLPEWWHALGDARLDSLVERARGANLDLKLAAARLREARALRTQAGSGRSPAIEGHAGYARAQRSLNATASSPAISTARENDLYQAGFDASWEIDLFGRVQRSIEAAQAALEAVEADQDAVLVSLIGELARAYVELRGLQRRLAVARESIASQEDSASIVRSRVQAGLASELDLVRAQALVASSRARVPELERDVRERGHRIALLLGAAPAALLLELAVEAPVPEPRAEPDLGLPAQLLARRPDLKRAERELAAQSARIGVAEAARYPRLDLLGSLAWLATELRDLPEGDSLAWSLGASLGFTVHDAGRKGAQVEIEAARAAGLHISYRQAVLAALKEVEDALSGLEAARQRANLLAEAAGEQRSAAQLGRELYAAGLTDYLAVLDAERQLLEVQDQLAQAQTQRSVQFVAVCKALGGGWDPAAPLAAVEAIAWPATKQR